MLSAWHSSGWQQNNAIPGRVSGSPTASDMAVSAMPVGTLGIHNLGLSATQQGAAAVEARVFHLLFCDGFTYYTAAPSFPKSCKVQYGMVFFWKLWQEMMHWSCLSRLICRSWFCHYIWQTASMVELFRWIEQSWYSACKTHANTLCSSTTCSGVSSVGTLSPLNLRAVEEILGGSEVSIDAAMDVFQFASMQKSFQCFWSLWQVYTRGFLAKRSKNLPWWSKRQLRWGRSVPGTNL